MDDIAIKVENVGKVFKLPHEKSSSIKSKLINFKKRGYEQQKVLNNISFEIKKGEFFGIVGRNGSGKSTLLKMLAGIYTPTSGHIQVNGKLTPFIELGVGFNPELTGRENVFLNGALLGFNRAEMARMYDDIVAFAELEKFMDQKLKNYSSGMQVRLAFSIAIRAKSDILLIDEVLAVGDAAFQTKCFDYFHELKEKETTVIFVSHDRSSLERFCERGILIEDGEITTSGQITKVLQSYSRVVLAELDKPHTEKSDTPQRKAQQYAAIENVQVLSKGKPKRKFLFGEAVTARFEVKVLGDIVNPTLGLTIWQKNVNRAVYATNTLIEEQRNTGNFKKGDRISFTAELPSLLNDGEYYVEPAIANESATVFFDQLPKGQTFFISGSNNPHSIIASNKSIVLSKE